MSLIQDKIVLNRGTYTWPFEFLLPDNLPPSSGPNPEFYPHIKYYARAALSKPWYKPNVTQTYLLTISPRINLVDMNGTQEALHFAGQNRKQLRLQGSLLQSSIVPGQSLSIQINLANPKETIIKSIEASFIQHRETAMDRHKEVIFSVNLPGLSEFNELQLQRNFDLLVPHMYLTPTNKFATTHDGYSYYLSVHYQLRLEVKPHGILTNFEVSVPVKVGTEAKWEEQQREQNYDFKMSPKYYKQSRFQ